MDDQRTVPAPHVETDVVVVGAGPAGLFAAFYAGLRGLRVAVVDALPEPGGQVAALYPEKAVLDVAALPTVTGRGLVAGLLEQAERYSPTWLLGRRALGLDRSGDTWRLTLSDGTTVVTGAVVVTGGIGAFAPRALPVGAEWVGRGVSYFVPDPQVHRDRDVVVVGGGDSALDWVTMLTPLARSVTLVHRRAAFRAHAASVAEVRASTADVHTDTEVLAIDGGPHGLTSVVLGHRGGAVTTVPAQAVVAALGFVSDIGPLRSWGLELQGRAIRVDSAMRTNLPGVYAAGDVTDYDGKVRLMVVGFGEAATAVNNAAVFLDPTADVFPGHSTDVALASLPVRA